MFHRGIIAGVLAGAMVCAIGAQAEAVRLIGKTPFVQGSQSLIALESTGGVDYPDRSNGSLFAGAETGSLFAPYPVRMPAAQATVTQASASAFQIQPRTGAGGWQVRQLRQLISHAESRQHGYDAVQHGARIKPAKRPTEMTLAEIYDWIDATPGQPHAIGRYQFIPTTLRMVAERAGAGDHLMFTPALQDRLADELLADAGFDRFQSGRLGRHAFMNNLARIWAGLPNQTGRSHYHGYAGNKAAMSWEAFDAAMIRIFEG